MVILFVAILLFVVIFPLLNRGPGGSSMETSTVIRGSIVETVDSYGILEARPSITLIWKSDGIVDDFDLEVGDIVEVDQVLLELDLTSQSPEILGAYTDLLEAQNELDLLTTTDAEYQDVLADLVYQEKMLVNKHADKLAWNYGQSSEERVDAVHDNYYDARSEVWELEDAFDEVKSLDENDPARIAALEALEDGKFKRDSLLRALNQVMGIQFDIAVETDFIEYDQQVAAVAEARVAYNRYLNRSEEINAVQATVQSFQNLVNEAKIITSAFGTVTSINAVPGEVVSEGIEAVRVDNMDNLIVKVNISQVDINKIEVGQLASLSFDAIYKKEYTGFIQSISGEGSADENGIVQYEVEIKVEDADEDIKSGFTVVASIVVSEAENALLVINDSIMTQTDGTNVVALINDDGSTSIIPVEIKARSDVYTGIFSSEIEEGNQVAVLASYGGNSLFDQMREMRTGGNGAGNGEMRELRNSMINAN